MYKCVCCKLKLKSVSGFGLHIKSEKHKNNENKIVNKCFFECLICGETFSHSGKYILHASNCDNNMSNYNNDKSSFEESNDESSFEESNDKSSLKKNNSSATIIMLKKEIKHCAAEKNKIISKLRKEIDFLNKVNNEKNDNQTKNNNEIKNAKNNLSNIDVFKNKVVKHIISKYSPLPLVKFDTDALYNGEDLRPYTISRHLISNDDFFSEYTDEKDRENMYNDELCDRLCNSISNFYKSRNVEDYSIFNVDINDHGQNVFLIRKYDDELNKDVWIDDYSLIKKLIINPVINYIKKYANIYIEHFKNKKISESIIDKVKAKLIVCKYYLNGVQDGYIVNNLLSYMSDDFKFNKYDV